MDGLAWDGIFNQNFGKLDGVLDGFHKDDDLIELQGIQKVHKLSILLIFFEF